MNEDDPEQAPVLICLNLQRRYAKPGTRWHVPRIASVIGPIQTSMAWARRRGMNLLHVHTIAGADEPIGGCEPRVDEPVYFKTGASFFQSREFAKHRSGSGLRAFLVGFTSSRDCLAAANDAERLGARLVFITDAMASTRLRDFAPETVDDVVAALLGEAAVATTIADLLAREPDFCPYQSLGASWGALTNGNIAK